MRRLTFVAIFAAALSAFLFSNSAFAQEKPLFDIINSCFDLMGANLDCYSSREVCTETDILELKKAAKINMQDILALFKNGNIIHMQLTMIQAKQLRERANALSCQIAHAPKASSFCDDIGVLWINQAELLLISFLFNLFFEGFLTGIFFVANIFLFVFITNIYALCLL